MAQKNERFKTNPKSTDYWDVDPKVLSHFIKNLIFYHKLRLVKTFYIEKSLGF